MRIVSPYKAFAPEIHQDAAAITSFDWCEALRMLDYSVRRTCGVSVHALTDEATDVPISALRYTVPATRLQQWLVEIRLAYLESPAFDQDTVLVSPDTLVLGNLAACLRPGVDLALLVRPKFQGQWKAILNSVQWWSYAAKDRLIAFYREAVARGRALEERYQVWGGDTEALRELLEPIQEGVAHRRDLCVDMVPARRLFQSLSEEDMQRLEAGTFTRPTVPIFDFKYTRKQYMPAAFAALFPEVA